MKLAGSIILYNPGMDVWDNICSYIDAVDRLYVIDNSEKYNKSLIRLICRNNKCRYISLNGNRGIAYALNVGVNYSVREGYTWLLTMDQDSKIASEQVKIMIHYIEDVHNHLVKIVCPNYRHNGKRWNSSDSVEFVRQAITSGSIIDVNVCKELGGFLNKLFIGEVDHEYCIRLILKGYKIARLNDVYMEHQLGSPTKHGNLISYNYPPIRYYYAVRNNLYVYFKYRKYKFVEDICREKPKNIKNLLFTIFYETRSLKKYAYMILGAKDFLVGKMGKKGCGR